MQRAPSVPVETDAIKEARRTLSRQFGSLLHEAGPVRALLLRVPRAEPDPVNDVEAAIEYLRPPDVQDLTHCILIGDEAVTQVYVRPLADLMAERMRLDASIAARMRQEMPEGPSQKLFQAPEDPRRRWRLAIRIDHDQVRQMADHDLDFLADEIGPQLDTPRFQDLCAVYLIADQDDVRLESDLFLQELREVWEDEDRRRRFEQEMSQKIEAEQRRKQQEKDDLLRSIETRFGGIRKISGGVAARDPVATRSAPVHDPAPQVTREDAAGLQGKVGQRVQRLERRLDRGMPLMEDVSYIHADDEGPFSTIHDGAVAGSPAHGSSIHSAPEETAIHGSPDDVPIHDHAGPRTPEQTTGSTTTAEAVPAAPTAGIERPEATASGHDRPDPEALATDPGSDPLGSEAPLPRRGLRRKGRSLDPGPAPLRRQHRAVQEQVDALGSPRPPVDTRRTRTLVGRGASEDPEPEDGPTVPTAATEEAALHAPRLSRSHPDRPGQQDLCHALEGAGFSLMLDPDTPGHTIHVAAERPVGDPQRIVARFDERLDTATARELLKTARELEVDLVLCVTPRVEPEGKRLLVATKVKIVSPEKLDAFEF